MASNFSVKSWIVGAWTKYLFNYINLSSLEWAVWTPTVPWLGSSQQSTFNTIVSSLVWGDAVTVTAVSTSFYFPPPPLDTGASCSFGRMIIAVFSPCLGVSVSPAVVLSDLLGGVTNSNASFPTTDCPQCPDTATCALPLIAADLITNYCGDSVMAVYCAHYTHDYVFLTPEHSHQSGGEKRFRLFNRSHCIAL